MLGAKFGVCCYNDHMTRNQAIALITSRLADLDDERLQAVGELVQDDDSTLPRPLSARELELIEQSRRDFGEGRTLSSAEARTSIDEALAAHGVPKSQ